MKLSKHIRKEMGIYYLGHSINDIYLLIIPILLPFIRREFGLSYAQSGLILTAHIGIRSLFSYISGHLGDKYDKRLILSVGFILSAIFLAGLVVTGSLFTLVGTLLLLAVGVSTFHPLATALVGEEANSEHTAFHIGIFESFGATGIMVATISFGIMTEYLGWRMSCLILALPALPLSWAYLKMKKEEIDETIKAEVKVDKFYILEFILGRGIRALGVGALFSFLPTFATDNLGLTESGSVWVMTIFFLGGIIGSLIGGWYADKKTPLLLIWSSTLLIVPLIAGITYISNIFLVVLLVSLIGFMNGGFFTPQNAWLTTVSTQSTRGKVLGAAFLIDGISITIAPTLFGWIADQVGLAGSFRWSLLPIILSIVIFVRLYYLYLQENLEERHLSQLFLNKS